MVIYSFTSANNAPVPFQPSTSRSRTRYQLVPLVTHCLHTPKGRYCYCHWKKKYLSTVFQITASPSARSRQLWRRTGNFFKTFLQFYVYDLRFKAAWLTTFFVEFWTLLSMSTSSLFSCDQAALQMVFSVRPSVCLSHLFHHVPIMVPSWNFQELLPWSKVMSMQKVRGQRSRSQRSTANLAVSGL